MRAVYGLTMAGKLAALVLATALAGTSAGAARYNVACAAAGAPACRTACGSNTHTVVCFAQVRGGRCFKYCGPPRR